MKKLNKLVAILVAMAMVLSLTVISAFAADEWKTELQGKYAESLDKAAITKILDVPADVTSPTSTFWFEFTPDSQPATTNDLATPTKYGKIEFAQNGTGTQKGSLKLSEVFTLGTDIKVPGEYVFTVKELDDAVANGDHASSFTKVTQAPNDATEAIKYSGQQYKLRMYVINDGDNLKIKAITVAPITTTTTEGSTSTTTTEGEKVDPTVTEETTEGGATSITDYSDVEFTNYYTKELKLPENPTPEQTKEGVFNIGKIVDGAGDKTAKYPFTVKVTLDEQTTADSSKTYIGKVGDAEYTFDFAKGAKEKTVTGIMIGHNEKLVFATFPAGAKVEITETLSDASCNIQNKAKYEQSVSAGLTAESGTTAENVDLKASTGYINTVTAETVTNTLDPNKITPTGILISNLPYIALALVAIGGLVAYVVVRRRQSDEA